MMAADREAAIAERARLVERLRSMPLLMRERQQWLLWKFEQHEGEPKPRKVPYYANGSKRFGKQGSDDDRAKLVDFDTALRRLGGSMHFEGLGFAWLPGDGLIGIDIDGAIDQETGEVSELCLQAIERSASYTERSVSGKGVHIVVAGETKTNKSDAIGLEVYTGRQFFTCTGTHWAGTPREIRPVAADALAWLHERIDVAKRKPPAADRQPVSMPMPAMGGDLVGWLESALSALRPDCAYNDWIGIGMALKSALGDGGLRLWDYWSSKAGERYAGIHQIEKHWASFHGTDADGALTVFKMARKAKWKPPREWHAVYGGRPALELVPRSGSAPDRSNDGPPDPDPPPPNSAGEVVQLGKKPRAQKKPRGPQEGGGGVVQRLIDSFALLYGTDQVWDGEKRITMVVKNLRLIFGSPIVNMWLSHPDRRLLMPEQLVFEPGAEVDDDTVNLFDGFAMEPREATEQDVKPMLDLLKHLCSLSASTAAGVELVYRQVLAWLALPIQQPGAKLRFALVFHGPQGTGKNLFFDGYRHIFGKYGKMVGQTELEDRFNGYLSGKLVLIANEVVTRQELFHHKNKLKWVITEDEIPIRGMHKEVRWESNHANVVFLSNELQPVALEKDDRRHLVVYTPAAEDHDLYLRVADFLKNDGSAKFMHYLQRVDIEDFNEFTKPLMTEAKQTLIELGLKPAERFVNEWLEGFLPLPINVCSAEQLYRVFRRWCDLNGEKYPPPQATFTKTCERHVFERVDRDPFSGERLPPALSYKVIALKDQIGARKCVRCWLPRGTGPLAGVTEGEWAASAVDMFEAAASRFGRTHVEADA